MEGLHPVLLPAGPAHRPHLHLPRADEQGVQAPRPRHRGRLRRTVRRGAAADPSLVSNSS